ncbi:MAG: class I SAM-dependent methyltransferase [Candidatus Kariarchaeaceae archaeon]|jgi:ubiquinone/menaquinone biosynthesis C-methylase UbiE
MKNIENKKFRSILVSNGYYQGRTRMMTKEEILERFQKEDAKRYSSWDPIYVIEWEPLFSISIQFLKFVFANKKVRVLDIGAGTGYLSKRILNELEGSEIIISDFSENMLSAVDDYLCDFKGRYQKRVLDFQEENLGNAEYDIIVSSMAIHHLRDISEYRKLYENINAALKYNGIFLCIDMITGADNCVERFYKKVWTKHLIINFGKTESDRILKQYGREDSPISITNHLELLQSCGFVSDCIGKYYNFCSYYGRKFLKQKVNNSGKKE